jgi:hypothetical protein
MGPDYIRIMRILGEIESEYIRELRDISSAQSQDSRRYYLNGIQALREAKARIRKKYEKKTPRKPNPATRWYHFWRDNF